MKPYSGSDMVKIPDDPQKIQQDNRQTVTDNLRDAYNVVEKLIQKSYQQKKMEVNFQLRNIRSDISRIRSEIESKELDGFSGKKGNLGELYTTEDMFLTTASEMLDLANSYLVSENIDTHSLEVHLSQFKKAFNSRIIVDKDILNEFKLKEMESATESRVLSGKKPVLQKVVPAPSENPVFQTDNVSNPDDQASSSMDKDIESHISEEHDAKISQDINNELDTETLSKLYNYFNLLEHKYSTYQPEVSNDGNYIGNSKWSTDISDRWIVGIVKDGLFKTPLIFETYWHPTEDLKELMNFIQSEGNSVAKDQYKSLCLVNSSWNDEIREWARTFMHPRLILFLYELDTSNLHFNETVVSAASLSMWHNSEKKPETLEDKLVSLLDEMEYFNASDLMERTGLNVKNADNFLKEMAKKNRIVDIGFGTSKYTRSKE
ncbi:hypothetical protein V7O66_05995 [Methanolobus sp. ZRKC3]|uniref:hypothetical protein n=1 Tax=Methanolobus sp. ZRKC3 TaxID=3125786 RepID=UPI003254BD2F